MARVLVAVFGLCSVLLAGQPGGITAEDYFSFNTVTDPRLSPDGKWVAYTVTRIDQASNRRMARIWLVASDGNQLPRPLTAENVSSNTPRWAPDGKHLAFVSTRDGNKAQLWMLPLAGGEAVRITNLDGGVSAIEGSPDSTRVVALTRSGPPPSTKSDVKHYSRIKYKLNDSGFFDDLRSHIVVVDVKSHSAKQITSGDAWNDQDPHWSPDASRIAFVSDRSGKELDLAENEDVWTIAPEGGALQKITAQPGAYHNPIWSPDGQRIAYLADTDAEDIPTLEIAP